MIDKKSILKMVEHVFKKGQGYPDRKLMHPQREWGIGILVFVITTLCGSLFTSALYVEYRDKVEVESNLAVSAVQHDTVLIEDALEYYKVRTAQFEKLTVPSVTLEEMSVEDVSESEGDGAIKIPEAVSTENTDLTETESGDVSAEDDTDSIQPLQEDG